MSVMLGARNDRTGASIVGAGVHLRRAFVRACVGTGGAKLFSAGTTRAFRRINGMADQLSIMLDGMGPAQKITLDFVDRFTRQEFELGGAFDAFCDDRQSEAMRKTHHGPHDGCGLVIMLEIRDEGTIGDV